MLTPVEVAIINMFNKYINDPSNWYNRVYLCCENHNSENNLAIIGFNCIKYYSLKQAEHDWKYKISKNIEYSSRRHTIIPICRWTPKVFDKYILNYKLKNIYWGGEIKIL